jgi:hypothetical protein
MNYSKTEMLLLAIAWAALTGGIAFGALVSKGILESHQDMCEPEAIVTFAGSVFLSLAAWGLLMLAVNYSRRLRKIERMLEEMKN